MVQSHRNQWNHSQIQVHVLLWILVVVLFVIVGGPIPSKCLPIQWTTPQLWTRMEASVCAAESKQQARGKRGLIGVESSTHVHSCIDVCLLVRLENV